MLRTRALRPDLPLQKWRNQSSSQQAAHSAWLTAGLGVQLAALDGRDGHTGAYSAVSGSTVSSVRPTEPKFRPDGECAADEQRCGVQSSVRKCAPERVQSKFHAWFQPSSASEHARHELGQHDALDEPSRRG